MISLIARVDQSTYLRHLALRDALAEIGYRLGLIQAPAGGHYFVVTRWGMRREMADIDQVDAFAQQVGAGS